MKLIPAVMAIILAMKDVDFWTSCLVVLAPPLASSSYVANILRVNERCIVLLFLLHACWEEALFLSEAIMSLEGNR